MREFLLNDEEIRACKAKELVIYREEDIRAYPPDRAIAKEAQKKLVGWLVKNNIRTEWSKKTDKKWQSLLKELE